jgi:hypothetical protein
MQGSERLVGQQDGPSTPRQMRERTNKACENTDNEGVMTHWGLVIAKSKERGVCNIVSSLAI